MESELGRRAEALRGREREIEALNAERASLRERLEAAEAEIGTLRVELDGAQVRADEELRTMTLFVRQLEEMRVGARGAATRIRLGALREAAEVSARIVDATDPRCGAVRDRILDALERALDRIEAGWEPGPDVDAPVPLTRSAAGRVALAGGQLGPVRRRVRVDVGPFADFSQLVRFEDAANSIGATGDLSIKRFSGGRARIDVALSEPVDLLRELEESCDLDFRVRSRSEDEIVLDVDA
ncbi:MAG TPA: hypothetical protein VFH44_11770 [Solirubrobacterales bacterium]|nr:hypothetical protein [Solirubrobacterales bacterium]